MILDLSGGYSGSFATVVSDPFLIDGTYYQLTPKYNSTNVTLIVAPVLAWIPMQPRRPNKTGDKENYLLC